MTDEQQMVSEDDYSTYTVYELKDDLKERGLKVSGKKADLISRLVSDLNSTIESVENVIEQTEEATEAIEIAADETMEAVEDALETAEELEGKANTIVTRWNALSRNQKLMGGLVAIVVIGFVAISGGYITF